jgi:RNA polymerase sigma-70 factor (ECF subfamily)
MTPAEFREMYEANFDLVWRMLVRLGVRESDALDQAQQVFLTAHLRLETFAGRSQLSTWLCGICRCVASDYRRSARYRREVLRATLDFDSLVFGEDGTHDAPASKRLAEVILDKLPERQRTVFVLFELEEMLGSEIAALLEISVGTVRSRLRLARAAFAREVKRLAVRGASFTEPAARAVFRKGLEAVD